MKRDALQTIALPAADGKLVPYQVREPRKFERPSRPFTRRALAAHVLADSAGLLADPELACHRMKRLLALHGCD